ncbi:hypothetical protein J6590_077236 [Homalodisca vitripennis]|nr:hypothetical protein J6590_077236 [Homalodisca vitripennis]
MDNVKYSENIERLILKAVELQTSNAEEAKIENFSLVTANFFFFLIKISRVNVFIEELRANHKDLEIFDFNHISRRLFTSHGMNLRVPGKRLFAKLIIEALLRINIAGCDPSSFIMASSANKPPSTTGPSDDT